MKSRHIALLLLNLAAAAVAASIAPAYGQGISVVSGSVSDSSGRALPSVRIRFLEIRRDEYSREDGTFRVTEIPAGTHTVMFTRIGYQAVTRLLLVTPGGRGAEIHVQMTPTLVQLATMIVTGTVGTREASEALSPTTVLDGEQLARRLSTTVAATLAREPGVSAAGMGPATARPVIRGLGGDRVVILEDGARSGDLSSTSPDHAVAIDPLNASRFETVRGPMSLLYGSSALGGVVNVIRDEIPTTLGEHLHGSVSIEGTSVNSGLAAAADATTAVGKVALRAEGSIRTTGDLRTPTGTLANTGLSSFTTGAGASLVQPQGHIGAAWRYYQNSYGIPGGFVGGHTSGVDVDMQRHSVRLEREHRPSRGAIVNLKSGLSFTDYYHAELQPSGSVSTAFDQQMVAANTVLRHDEAGIFSHGAAGVQAQYRTVSTAGALKTPSTRDYSVAAFVVEEWERGLLHVQGGVRYDWSRIEPLERDASVTVSGVRIPARPREFGSVSGALGVLLHMSESFQGGASVSRAFRIPDFNELYSDGPHLAAYSYDVGNPRLRQETGVGVDVFARIARPGLRAEAAIFRNQMQAFIFPRNTGEIGPQGGRPKFQYVGKNAQLYGAEGSLEWNFAPRLVLDGNVSWVVGNLRGSPDSIPAIDDEPARAGSTHLPLMPPLNGNVGVRYETGKLFVGVDTRLAARQTRLGDFETTTEGYQVVNATIGVRIQSGGRLSTITLRTENIADREYRDHLSRIKSITPEAGRSFSLLYRLMF